MSAGEVEEAPQVLEIGKSLTGASSKTKESKLDAIETAFGSMRLSVEYRAETEFEVEEPKNAQEEVGVLDIDEDYFRPAAKRPSAAAATAPAATEAAAPRSLLSTTANKRVSALTAGRAQLSGSPPMSGTGASTAVSSAGSSPQGSPALTEGLLLRNPAPTTSVFPASASSKPLAGLSSLRSGVSGPPSVSVALGTGIGSGTSPLSTRGSLASPATQIEGAAFLTHGRRASTTIGGERRLRTLSSYSSERVRSPSCMRQACFC
ncbi:hypothetical protein FA09DRAFT_185461 [Tilletiopsis washingtonensis]|uniref:Uncharacterized protein n=1 Tax=Tilletiopsis washingtonensis TaxID=58919 RepID=A0A316ZHA1_9BASI|nr:hypothetical protein FA09DRAFT_185461 [Tilletiopsis washingtonensis]PWO00415.1 hypothetical protein FA09DRAFT_185461 [Tilletiopsis washingtonensis]